MKRFVAACALLPSLVFAQSKHIPTIDELLSLKTAGSAHISPDGAWVTYLVNETDWKGDQFISHLWIVRSEGGESRQLTRGAKTVGQPRWSPDGKWISFTSPRQGDTTQVFAIRPDGGEAIQLTKSTSGSVQGYLWSPDGRTIAYTANEPNPELRARRDTLGDWEVVRRDYQHQHLFTIDVASAMNAPAQGTLRTKGRTYSVGNFSWSPDGKRIAFSATVNPDLINGMTSDVYVLNLADNGVRKLVGHEGPDGNPVWSPDGKQIAFSTLMGKKPFFATNNKIAVVPADGGTVRVLSESFDEQPFGLNWTPAGLYFAASARTALHVYRIDPQTSRITTISQPANALLYGWSFTNDGTQGGFLIASPTSLPEVAVSRTAQWAPRVLTRFTAQTDSLVVGTREVISWKSQDGATIEGVLVKPANFDPSKKYPLLVKIHGGPTGVDQPAMLAERRTYPIDTWVGRGALALMVNYRGSAGYGEKFRLLNVRNLGVGDAWDVLSGVDYLISKGWVDSTRLGSMGWSQGGYISAFLTTSSTRFKAISVGAGISDWATYYYNTDITPFTINYLGADPVADPEIYRKTSPVSYVKNARTPTLIQHGDNDRRVPIANAYQLRQALEDRGVKVEMIVYKGFGHGINRPKAQRAVMNHNLVWFNHYIFGDALPDLRSPLAPPKALQATQSP